MMLRNTLLAAPGFSTISSPLSRARGCSKYNVDLLLDQYGLHSQLTAVVAYPHCRTLRGTGRLLYSIIPIAGNHGRGGLVFHLV